jgi:hypothetical protein
MNKYFPDYVKSVFKQGLGLTVYTAIDADNEESLNIFHIDNYYTDKMEMTPEKYLEKFPDAWEYQLFKTEDGYGYLILIDVPPTWDSPSDVEEIESDTLYESREEALVELLKQIMIDRLEDCHEYYYYRQSYDDEFSEQNLV